MRIYRLHLRSSPARFAFPPLAIVGLLVLYNRSDFWRGIWPETGAAVAVSAFFVSLFCAGVSAWSAARSEVLGLRTQAARGTVRAFSLEKMAFSADLTWLLGAYAVTAASAFVVTARASFPAGVWSFAGYTLLGLLLVILASSWGWFIGRLLDPAVAALSSVLSWYVVASVVGDLSDATPVSGPPWMALRFDVLGVRLLAVLLFAIAVCALPGRAADKGARAWRIGMGSAIAALAGVTLVHVATPILVPRPPSASPLCVDGTMTYCLWPEHEKYVALVRAIDAEVAALPIELQLPDRVVDYALSGSRRWVDGIEVEQEGEFAAEFDISEGSRWALARGVATAITVEVFSDCRTPQGLNDPEHRWDQLQAWLEARLAGGGNPDYTTNTAQGMQPAWQMGRRVAAEMTDEKQAAWAAGVIGSRTRAYCIGR